MKRLVLILICALLCALPALGEGPSEGGDLFDALPDGPDTPQTPRDESPAPDGESILLDINGQSVRLAFDRSPEYSSIKNGRVQASYYAYGDDGNTLYELYMVFPDTARAGMVITPEYATLTGEECSVALIISSREMERYYFSSTLGGTVYPAGTDFSITLDSVESSDAGTTYAGVLSATLATVDGGSDGASASLTLPSAAFSFTVGGFSAKPEAPRSTGAPLDLRKT